MPTKDKKKFTVMFVNQDLVEIYASNKIEAMKLARIKQRENKSCQTVVLLRDENNKII